MRLRAGSPQLRTAGLVSFGMRLCAFGWGLPAALCAVLLPVCGAQDAKPSGVAKAGETISGPAGLVVVPVVVHDKKGLVTTLTQSDFAITVDGKPQTIRSFDRDADVPLSVGLLVDVAPAQTAALEDEQRASQRFLDSFLLPAKGNRPADTAFVLQFAHTAELLQDITDSRTLLAAGLKEIGTQAPGSPEEDSGTQTASGGNGGSNPNSGGGSSPNNNGGYGNGPYGRRGGGSPRGGTTGGTSASNRPISGNVLYDAVFLSSADVLSKRTGRRVLILVTNGVDRHSKESLTEAIEAAQRADTVVYGVYYKGQVDRGYGPIRQGGGYGGYDPYNPYGYPPTTGGSTDPGTYRDPDGRKILQRLCDETGGRMFEWKGKGSIEEIYKEIGEELRAQYRLGFTPSYEAASAGYHPVQLTLTSPTEKKLDVQTRIGYYSGEPKTR